MRIYEAKDYEGMSRKAANIIAAQIEMKPDCVLGLATGSSPIGTYKRLIEGYENGDLDFSEVKSVNLDEYKGLSKENDQSYYYFMNEKLFRHVNIKPENTNLPDGLATDDDAECTRYDAVVAATGGIDLQLLGLGHNGHIGFNEPAQEYAKGTNCVALTQSTIDANSRLFEKAEDVPKFAYTMGVGTIMKARKILIIVSGADKAKIVRQAFFGPVTPEVPASILQFHNDVTIVGDEAALAEIQEFI